MVRGMAKGRDDRIFVGDYGKELLWKQSVLGITLLSSSSNAVSEREVYCKDGGEHPGKPTEIFAFLILTFFSVS